MWAIISISAMVSSLISVVILLNRREVRRDLLGQAALPSVKTSLDSWKAGTNADYFAHTKFTAKREHSYTGPWCEYYVNRRRITGTLGRQIFRILVERENNQKFRENKSYGQEMLDIAIREAQDKLKAIRQKSEETK